MVRLRTKIKLRAVDVAQPMIMHWFASGELTPHQFKEILMSVACELALTHAGALDANFERRVLERLTALKAEVLRRDHDLGVRAIWLESLRTLI